MERDWEKQPPPEWERRLREISPVTDQLAHLRFRWRAPKPFWNWPDAGQWELYACRPKHLVSAERAKQFARPWQDLPTEGERQARKAVVTSYQYHMWHTHGLSVGRFWILQGPAGGTPVEYTAEEQAFLEGNNWLPFAPPLGFFPQCPFDERVVKNILIRDRFLKAGKDMDRLGQMDSTAALKAEDDAADKLRRTEYLAWWAELMGPCKEFMKSQVFKEEAQDVLPPAPDDLADRLATWREEFIEHGHVIGATTAPMKQVQMPIPGAVPA